MLARWQPRHLVGITLGYWATLAATTLGDAARAVWRVTHLPGTHGAVAGAYADGLLTFTATESGRAIWSGAVPPGMLLDWLAGPPVLLVLAWLWARGRARRGAGDRALEPATGALRLEAEAPPQLGAARDAEVARPLSSRRGAPERVRRRDA